MYSPSPLSQPHFQELDEAVLSEVETGNKLSHSPLRLACSPLPRPGTQPLPLIFDNWLTVSCAVTWNSIIPLAAPEVPILSVVITRADVCIKRGCGHLLSC
jgi:hypothetical protein